jgi:hypothetical protein
MVGAPAGCVWSILLSSVASGRSRCRARREEGCAAMAGKFELYQDKAGKFRFRLKASNG